MTGQRGFMSAGFGAHPTGHLLRGLFGHHDRERFRIVGLALDRDDGSDFRRDIAAGCDAFVPLAACDDAAAAGAIGRAGIDILVDLHGWLQNHRMAILARRPAPLQVTWLGFPGTTGAPFIDWLIGDGIVSPAADQRHFTERPVRLPESYQANDPQPAVGPATSRRDHGLPEDAVVLACFNVAYKIDPESFALFCRVLVAGRSSLALLDSDRLARHLEAACLAMAGMARAGLAPAALDIAPVGREARKGQTKGL